MPHEMTIRVYWEDTDAGGIVYYANYLRFLERGRTEALRGLGVDQGRLRAETGLLMVVRSAAIDWLAPARLDDLLIVETRAGRIGGASLTLRQIVRHAGGSPGGDLGGDLAGNPGGDHACGAVLLQADIKIACVDPSGKPARFPADLRARLELMKA
jgi:acyl-CoA thioester hydrolase